MQERIRLTLKVHEYANESAKNQSTAFILVYTGICKYKLNQY